MCKALGAFLLIQSFGHGDSKTSLVLCLLLLPHSNLVLGSSKELKLVKISMSYILHEERRGCDGGILSPAPIPGLVKMSATAFASGS